MSTARVLLLYLLYIVLIGGITTVVVLSLHSNGKPETAAKPVTHTKVAKQPVAPVKPTAPSTPATPKPTTSAGAIAGNAGTSVGKNVTTPATATANAATSGQLANTGPGDVAAIFAGTVVIGYVAYRRQLATKL